jgi:hypothetical protein
MYLNTNLSETAAVHLYEEHEFIHPYSWLEISDLTFFFF